MMVYPTALLSVGIILLDFTSCHRSRNLGISNRVTRGGAAQGIVKQLLAPDKYDKTVRPDVDSGHPTRVLVDLQVNTISSVSETSMEYTIDVFLRQRWREPRLVHRDVNVTVALTYQYDKLWVPDLFLSNLKRGTFHDITMPNRFVQLDPSGRLVYGQRLTLTLACDMDLQSFPWDTQSCPIRIESYGHTVEDIVFEWNNSTGALQVQKENIRMPEFEYMGYSAGTCANKITTGAFTCLKAALILERQSGYYLAQTYIPSVLIVILSWISFWIDIHAVPARISVGLLTVLTLTTQSSGISNRLPRVSYIKAIDVWMSTCLCFVFGALIEYSIVQVLARRDPTQEKKETPYKEIKDEAAGPAAPSGGQHCCTCFHFLREESAKRLDIVSRFLFPFVFFVFNIVYWIYYITPRAFSIDQLLL